MKRAILAAVLALALPLHAQDGAEEAKLEQARQHVAKAKVHYGLGEYEQAAEEYIIVYRIKPVPAILYNVAQAYRQASKYDKARQFYKSYLRESPNAKNRAEVENQIKELDELLAKEKRARERPPVGLTQAPQLPPPQGAPLPLPGAQPEAKSPVSVAVTEAKQPPATGAAPASTAAPWRPQQPSATTATLPATAAPEKSHTLAYVAAGAAVAALGGGLAFTMKASSIDSELSARPHPTAVVDDLSSQSKSSHTMAALFLAVGVAAGVGAGLLYFAF